MSTTQSPNIPQAAPPPAASPQATPPVSPTTAALRDLAREVQDLTEQLLSLAGMINCSIEISAMTTEATTTIKNHFGLHDATDRLDDVLGLRAIRGLPPGSTLADDDNAVQATAATGVITATGVGMDWDGELTPISRYKACLKSILRLIAPTFEVLLVHREHNTLDTATDALPIALRGTTDVIIRRRRNFLLTTAARLARTLCMRVPHALSHTRLVVQLKPNITREYASYVNQSIAELFAADFRASGPVIAVLTDLNNDWTYLWLSRQGTNGEQRLHTVRLRTKLQGIQALATVLSHSEDDLERIHGLCKVQDLTPAPLV